MTTYDVVAELPESTVVAEYTEAYGKRLRSDGYQSEAALEAEFIRILQSLGYDYLEIHDEAALIANLRTQLELLNDYHFSDKEWEQFFKVAIANSNDGIVEKTFKMQQDHVQVLKRDDGSSRNIMLIDKNNIHNNRLQVLNQYTTTEGKHENRYDVTILVNGLPLVHMELKRRGVAIREAFNQIKRYQRDSFWAGCGLYQYVQIFVISNGTSTKYYSNTTRESHIKEASSAGKKTSKKTSNSFEFTSYWADANNKILSDLIDFTYTFFAKHTILNILTKYCIFTTEKLLMVMRPYQIAATEKIINRIRMTTAYKQLGTVKSGGYIWHTTGSGKTITSFKTAQLASKMEGIDKVLFVVDRKDLDYQTMREYDRFCKGAANGNKNTAVLTKQLGDDSRIIITTIQKLSVFVKKNKKHPVYQKHVVFIFDECHRSQFGEMHQLITKNFKKYHMFGFTGTPIFAVNASSSGNVNMRTTPQAFGDKLHTYTIVDAIRDNNVLPFRIDYVNTLKMKDGLTDEQIAKIDREKAMEAPERIAEVVGYILEHFDQKTKRNESYSLKGQRVLGFNSILAVSSIPMAKKYYLELKKQMAERNKQLTIATIYSYSTNEEDPEDGLGEEGFDNDALDKTSRDFLDSAIQDYNAMFGTSYDTSSDKFENYYKDLSMRVKNREVDLLIVVNMFLTGFDATTLNTLWVDKNLKQHGLIQAFSRTNRILNSVKTFGNIICFRNLEDNVNDAISLFGDKDAESIVCVKTFDAYYNGYMEKGQHVEGYAELVMKLQLEYPLGIPIVGEQAQKDFLKLFGKILRLRNILTSFDSFTGKEILAPRDFQDYQGTYIDVYDTLKPKNNGEKTNINDDIVFEMELIRQVEINIDYILMLVEKYHAGNCKDKEILVNIDKAIGSSPDLRSKRELIEDFIKTVNVATNVKDDWHRFVVEQKEKELQQIIAEEKLKPEATQRFIENAFRDGEIRTTGTEIDKLMPPMPLFGKKNAGQERIAKKKSLIGKLKAFFEKFFGV